MVPKVPSKVTIGDLRAGSGDIVGLDLGTFPGWIWGHSRSRIGGILGSIWGHSRAGFGGILWWIWGHCRLDPTPQIFQVLKLKIWFLGYLGSGVLREWGI